MEVDVGLDEASPTYALIGCSIMRLCSAMYGANLKVFMQVKIHQ